MTNTTPDEIKVINEVIKDNDWYQNYNELIECTDDNECLFSIRDILKELTKRINKLERKLSMKDRHLCDICEKEIDDKDLIQTGMSSKYTHTTKKGNILRNIGSYHKECYKQSLGEKA